MLKAHGITLGSTLLDQLLISLPMVCFIVIVIIIHISLCIQAYVYIYIHAYVGIYKYAWQQYYKKLCLLRLLYDQPALYIACAHMHTVAILTYDV